MHLPKFTIQICALISLGASAALASPSRSDSNQDALDGVKTAFRQFAIGYQSLGAEIVYLQTERGPSASLLGAGMLPQIGSQPLGFLKPIAGSDVRNSLSARDSVSAWIGLTDAFYSSLGSGNTKAEHDSLRVGIVPEPASLVAWTLIGSAFGVGAWRRRRSAV